MQVLPFYAACILKTTHVYYYLFSFRLFCWCGTNCIPTFVSLSSLLIKIFIFKITLPLLCPLWVLFQSLKLCWCIKFAKLRMGFTKCNRFLSMAAWKLKCFTNREICDSRVWWIFVSAYIHRNWNSPFIVLYCNFFNSKFTSRENYDRTWWISAMNY